MQLPDLVSEWFQILPLSKIRFWKVQSIFSHFVRKDTLHLSKTVSGLFGWYDYIISLSARTVDDMLSTVWGSNNGTYCFLAMFCIILSLHVCT
jgi:hypothetical protein